MMTADAAVDANALRAEAQTICCQMHRYYLTRTGRPQWPPRHAWPRQRSFQRWFTHQSVIKTTFLLYVRSSGAISAG